MKIAFGLLALAWFLLAAPAWCQSIAEVKASSEWMEVCVTGSVTYLQPDECYIEAFDRSGGIWVQGLTDGLAVGDSVIAFGTFAVVDGEPCVIDASIYLRGGPGTIRPFGMPNRAIGGASSFSPLWIWDYRSHKVPQTCGYTLVRDWEHATGLNNGGLLITTWGTVKASYYSPDTGAKWFYVDDGSSLVSDLGDTGVLVYSDADVIEGDFVTVTGVSSVEPSYDDSGRLIRVVRTRDAGDVAVAKPAPSLLHEYPFSDGFDSAVPDPRWCIRPSNGSMSLTTEPGWIALTAPPPVPTAFNGVSPQLVQYLRSDCDIEVKARVELRPEPAAVHRLWVVLNSSVLACADHGYSQVGGSYVKSLSLGNVKATMQMPSDTCYLRFRRRDSTIYANMSLDGVTYLASDVNLGSVGGGYLSIYATSSLSYGASTGTPFTAYIDYFRYTSVP